MKISKNGHKRRIYVDQQYHEKTTEANRNCRRSTNGMEIVWAKRSHNERNFRRLGQRKSDAIAAAFALDKWTQIYMRQFGRQKSKNWHKTLHEPTTQKPTHTIINIKNKSLCGLGRHINGRKKNRLFFVLAILHVRQQIPTKSHSEFTYQIDIIHNTFTLQK